MATNPRFTRAVSLATQAQAAVIAKFEESGMRQVKLFENRNSMKIAVMLQKDGVWNEQTGRIGTKLVMVYPDGRHQVGFGKVAVQNAWF